MKDKSIVLYVLNSLLVLGIIILFTLASSQYFIIAHDDMATCFIDRNRSLIENFFTSVYHGRYISNVMTKLQCGLFDIHPIVWLRSYGAIMKAIFTFIVFTMLSSSLFIFKNEAKSNIFKYICMPLTTLACYFVYLFAIHYHYEEMLYSFFYGFIFPFIFFILFWNKFINVYTNNSMLTKKDFYFFCILAFLLGISTEITIFVSFVALILILFFDSIQKNSYSKQFIPPTIILFISSMFYVFNPGFIYSAKDKGTLNGFNNMIKTAIDSFDEYFVLCSQIIKDYFLVITLSIILLLVIVISCKYYKNKTNFLKIVISLLISNYLFYFMLIFAGRNPENILFVGHYSTNIQVVFCFVYILFVTISYVSRNNFIKSFLIVIFIAFSLFYKFDFINNISEIFKIGIKNYIGHGGTVFYKNRYKAEAILLYYAVNNKKAIIPNNCDGFYLNLESYLYNVYNIKGFDEKNIVLIDEKEAYCEYIKNGGRIITNEEIEKGDFQKLKEEYAQNDNNSSK